MFCRQKLKMKVIPSQEEMSFPIVGKVAGSALTAEACRTLAVDTARK